MKRKLTVHCESRFSTPFMILDSCVNRESSRGSSLVRQKKKDSPMTDFSIILRSHNSCNTTRYGLLAQATLCSKQDQFKLKSECFFKDICIKLHFLEYSFKCLLQMQTDSVYSCIRKKVNNSIFVTSKDSALTWLLGMIKINCIIHICL